MYFKPTVLSKEEFVRIAKDVENYYSFIDEMDDSLRMTAKKYNIGIPFCPYSQAPAASIEDDLIDILGSEFEYWLFDCNRDWGNYNSKIKPSPNCHNFEDLWEYSKKEEDEG